VTKNNSQNNIKNELEIRVWFKSEFGIDYLDAVNQIKQTRKETERRWHQLLVKYNLI